jgi:membrane-associated protease RseP (regulator of RpoE activity)
MSTENPNPYALPPNTASPEPKPAVRGRSKPRVLLPLFLFLATCASTYLVGGWEFSLALMITLTAHELGHFLQARRYHVPASWPYFIPMPISPVGTMGAVIAMHPGMGNRKTLFDIAVTGPLAGLVPAMVFSILGLRLSTVTDLAADGPTILLGEPLLFKLLTHWIFGAIPEGQDVLLHPVAYAGWVGIFITALNLIPIGQLDGGHILYALLRRKSHPIAAALLIAAAVAVVVFGHWEWTLLILLLLFFGPRHPPTANDHVSLGAARATLGWCTLSFMFIGFTPTPFLMGN